MSLLDNSESSSSVLTMKCLGFSKNPSASSETNFEIGFGCIGRRASFNRSGCQSPNGVPRCNS